MNRQSGQEKTNHDNSVKGWAVNLSTAFNTQIKRGSKLKKYIIVVCLVLVVAFTGGFLTSHFTSNSKCENNNQQVCEHDGEINALLLQINILQNRLHDLTERSDFYYEVIMELLRVLDTQHEMVEEALGQMLYYRDLLNGITTEIHDLEKEIVRLQAQLDLLLGLVSFVPANWNGVWGQYWQGCCCDGGEYVFEAIFEINNGVITLLDDMGGDAYGIHKIGNSLLLVIDFGSDVLQGISVVFCAFRDGFIVSGSLLIFDEEMIDEVKSWLGDDITISQFLDTDYLSVMLPLDELVLLQREGGAK